MSLLMRSLNLLWKFQLIFFLFLENVILSSLKLNCWCYELSESVRWKRGDENFKLKHTAEISGKPTQFFQVALIYITSFCSYKQTGRWVKLKMQIFSCFSNC